METVVVIPARGGSKGVPGKNIKSLGGKPLIQHTIDAAKEVFNQSQIIISTDNLQIKETVEKLGTMVPFLRPKELATDTAGSREVLLHVVEFLSNKGRFPDVLVLLQPTSPFRTSHQIKMAMKLFKKQKGLDMVVSVKETKSNPYYVLFEEDENGYLKKSKKSDILRRQDVPKVWEYNGAIYVIKTSSLKKHGIANFEKTIKYEMDELSSIDIDTPLDWLLAEQIIKSREQG